MNKISEGLRIKAGMISLGERIAWGSDSTIMLQAAIEIERLEAEIRKAQLHIKHIGNDALRSENAELRAELEEASNTCGSGAGCLHKDATIDALREKLATLKQQEPIGYVFPAEDYSYSAIKPYANDPKLMPLHLAAGAQPVPDVKESLGHILDGWKSGVVSAQDSIVEVFKLRAMLEARKS